MIVWNFWNRWKKSFQFRCRLSKLWKLTMLEKKEKFENIAEAVEKVPLKHWCLISGCVSKKITPSLQGANTSVLITSKMAFPHRFWRQLWSINIDKYIIRHTALKLRAMMCSLFICGSKFMDFDCKLPVFADKYCCINLILNTGNTSFLLKFVALIFFAIRKANTATKSFCHLRFAPIWIKSMTIDHFLESTESEIW